MLDYYFKGSLRKGEVFTHGRDCATCLSKLVRCTHNVSSPLTVHHLDLEFLSFEFFMDSEISTYRSKKGAICTNVPWHCPYSTSHQEFIFGEYMNGNYPDWILFFTPTHVITRDRMPIVQANLNWMLRLMDTYLPNTTSVL